MAKVRAFIVLGFACLLAGTTFGQQAQRPYPVELKWVRQSVEYAAICVQTYRQAWQAVKARTADLEKDWAVILDVDETVLDNSGYQEILYRENKSFPYYWDEWVKEQRCPAVPGARAFLDSVRSLGKFAHIVFITNRNQHLAEATEANLRALGLMQDGDVLLCQRGKQDSKEKRRREVITGTGRCEGLGPRVIVALIGDQLADVTTYPEHIPPEQYRSHFLNAPEWGTKYFLLPNPQYGYWMRGYAR